MRQDDRWILCRAQRTRLGSRQPWGNRSRSSGSRESDIKHQFVEGRYDIQEKLDVVVDRLREDLLLEGHKPRRLIVLV